MKVGKYSFECHNVYCHEASVVCGPLEKEGPLGCYFDKSYDDLYCGEESFEKAEIRLFDDSFKLCLKKNKLPMKNIDLVIHSDLNNQIIVGSYCLRKYDVPTLGIYSACSGFTEGIAIASQFIENNFFSNVIVGISSHNGTSERQFRYPLEYGGKKSATTTFTVTSASHILLSTQESKIKVKRLTIGKVKDNNLNDPSDMGRSMAIAAYSTFIDHMRDFKISPDEYDLIITGDLSTYGKMLFEKYLEKDGIKLTNYEDAGLMIYSKEQNVYAGGSGCGCSASVTLGYIFKKLKSKEYKKVLIIATGALLNTVMTMQKESIPSIAHAVSFEGE